MFRPCQIPYAAPKSINLCRMPTGRNGAILLYHSHWVYLARVRGTPTVAVNGDSGEAAPNAVPAYAMALETLRQITAALVNSTGMSYQKRYRGTSELDNRFLGCFLLCPGSLKAVNSCLESVGSSVRIVGVYWRQHSLIKNDVYFMVGS